ncbi:MAG: phosphotransferase [Turicibacter sp.]
MEKDMIRELILRTISLFRTDELREIEIINNCRSDEERYIVFTTFATDEKIVFKIYLNSYTTLQNIETWATLSKSYSDHQIKTPLFLKSSQGSYGQTVEINQKVYHVWAEEWVDSLFCKGEDGVNLEAQSEDFIYQLGTLHGRMHQISKEQNIQGNCKSPWVLFETFSADEEYDENYENAYWLFSELNQTAADQYLLQAIWSSYTKKRQELEVLFKVLPQGMVQGDLSPRNLIISNDHELIGIYDYNLSGNDIYISECIQEAIYICYECYDEEWFDEPHTEYMDARFKAYVRGYEHTYGLNEDEQKAIDLVYNISRPFRWAKVKLTLDKLKENKIEDVNTRLKWMQQELNKKNVMGTEMINAHHLK